MKCSAPESGPMPMGDRMGQSWRCQMGQETIQKVACLFDGISDARCSCVLCCCRCCDMNSRCSQRRPSGERNVDASRTAIACKPEHGLSPQRRQASYPLCHQRWHVSRRLLVDQSLSGQVECFEDGRQEQVVNGRFASPLTVESISAMTDDACSSARLGTITPL